ncbi:MAG: DUF4271 domain-containing protein [Prevotellaceae bacterium]|jgi:hypothetical protein|nr:DUF4271 domain-containing protein [Prevotellaceae bacterium]
MYYTEILLSFAGSFAGRYFVSVRQDSVFERLPQAMGYTGETIPSCPQTEAWVFVCLGALFLLFVAAVLFSSSSLVWSVKLLLEIDDRTASFINPGAFYFLSRFLYVVFFIGVFSLFGYLYFRSAGDGFLLSEYWLFLGTTTVFLTLKLLLSHLLGFVFFDSSAFKVARRTYFNTLSLFGIVLYPLLVFHVYSSFLSCNVLIAIVLITALLSLVFFAFRLFQIFFTKTVDFFYILLYLCTLEILPFLLLFRIYGNIV